MIFIILIVFLISAFSFYSSRFNNPYTFTFIFGKKGSGKSTFMVKLMLRYIKAGWHVYTNISGVNIPGVRFFYVDGLTTCAPPPHSVLFIDEAGLIWDSRNFKTFDKGYTEFFKLQRKYRNRVYINSQSFDVDKRLRDLTDGMFLQTNIGNIIGISRPIIRKITLIDSTGNSDSRIADNLRFASFWTWKFTWLPRYFKYFDSFDAPVRPELVYDESVLSDIVETATAATKRRRWQSPKKFLKELKNKYSK